MTQSDVRYSEFPIKLQSVLRVPVDDTIRTLHSISAAVRNYRPEH